MDGLRKPAGAYLVLVSVAVAVFFIINPLLADAIEVQDVWYVLNILMAVALALGLVYTCAAKKRVDAQEGDRGVTRSYLEANVTFFAVAAATVLFLHSWLSLLANGADSLDGNHQAWVIWAAVHTALPIVLGVAGCRLWRNAS